MQRRMAQDTHCVPPNSALHTTGGRPWTIYRTPLPSRVGGTASNHGNGREGGKGQGKGNRLQLTVVSYNVLADSLVSFEYIPYCRTWNDAAWRVRPSRILQKVMDYEPDVICLQEVDKDLYQNFFVAHLESLGYAGAYCQRSGDKVDGCATFVRGYRFQLVEQENVMYRVQGHPVLDRDNVALLVVVDVFLQKNIASEHVVTGSRNNNGGGSCGSGDHFTAPPERTKIRTEHAREHNRSEEGGFRAARTAAPVVSTSVASKPSPPLRDAGKVLPVTAAARLVIANTHLLFNPKRGDIKMAQLMMLTDRVHRLSKSLRADGVIICGDFNMTPDSAFYHYMVKGELSVDGMNRFSASGQCRQGNPRAGQRKETDTCGTSLCRAVGLKHQGGGCTLGSFLRPFIPPSRHGGDRQPPCEMCASRPPHGASSFYLTGDAFSAEGDAPRGARVGSKFVVMDPLPCRCTIERGGKARGGETGSLKDGGGGRNGSLRGGEGGGGATGNAGGGRGVYHPPVLWPVNGEKFAFSTGEGPVMHPLRLKSAYSQQADAWGTGEPAFTTYHHMFKGTVDYIFYGPGPSLETPSGADGGNSPDGPTAEALQRLGGGKGSSLRCMGVSEPPLRCDLDYFGGLPSPEEPSDHVLLAVRFEIVPPPPPSP